MWYELAGKTSVLESSDITLNLSSLSYHRETRLFTLSQPASLTKYRDTHSCFVMIIKWDYSANCKFTKGICLSSVFLSSKDLLVELQYEDLSQFCFEMLTDLLLKKIQPFGITAYFLILQSLCSSANRPSSFQPLHILCGCSPTTRLPPFLSTLDTSSCPNRL